MAALRERERAVAAAMHELAAARKRAFRELQSRTEALEQAVRELALEAQKL